MAGDDNHNDKNKDDESTVPYQCTWHRHVWWYLVDPSTETLYTPPQVVGSGHLIQAAWTGWQRAVQQQQLQQQQERQRQQQQEKETQQSAQQSPRRKRKSKRRSSPSSSSSESTTSTVSLWTRLSVWWTQSVLDPLVEQTLRRFDGQKGTQSLSIPCLWVWMVWILLHTTIPYALTWYYSPTFYFTARHDHDDDHDPLDHDESSTTPTHSEDSSAFSQASHDHAWLVHHALAGYVPAWVLLANALGHVGTWLGLSVVRRGWSSVPGRLSSWMPTTTNDNHHWFGPWLVGHLSLYVLESTVCLLVLVSSLQAVVMWEPATLLWIQVVLQVTYLVTCVWEPAHGTAALGAVADSNRCRSHPVAASWWPSWPGGTASLVVAVVSLGHALVREETVVWYHINLYPLILPWFLSWVPFIESFWSLSSVSSHYDLPAVVTHWILTAYSWMERLWIVFASRDEENDLVHDDPAAVLDNGRTKTVYLDDDQDMYHPDHHHRHGHVLTLGQGLEFLIVLTCGWLILGSLYRVLSHLTLRPALSACSKLLVPASVLFVPWILIGLEELEWMAYHPDAWSTATTLDIVWWTCTRTLHLALIVTWTQGTWTLWLCGQAHQAWPVLGATTTMAAVWTSVVLWIVYDVRWKRIHQVLVLVLVWQLGQTARSMRRAVAAAYASGTTPTPPSTTPTEPPQRNDDDKDDHQEDTNPNAPPAAAAAAETSQPTTTPATVTSPPPPPFPPTNPKVGFAAALSSSSTTAAPAVPANKISLGMPNNPTSTGD